jgi:hypothetical protein
MPQAILGSTFTFQVLFVDDDGQPLPGITDASIEVFRLTSTGTKVVLVSAPMAPPTPPETGRFVYSYILDGSILDIGETLYAEYTGTDPVTPTTVRRKEEPLGIIADPASQGGGVRTNFVKGG